MYNIQCSSEAQDSKFQTTKLSEGAIARCFSVSASMKVLDVSGATALTRPPGTFSPEAVQVPKPSFLGKANFDGSGAGTSAPSESPDTESEEASTSTPLAAMDDVDDVDDVNLRQHLEERLAHLRVLQQQSLAQYLDCARALNALQSRSATSRNGVLLGTQPQSISPNLQVPSVPSVPSVRSFAPSSWGAVVTLMVKELPAYFTQEMFVSVLVERGFKHQFDFLYIPYRPERGCNMGYAIINFTRPEYAMQFQASFKGDCLDDEMRMTGRILVVEPAPVQGYEANYYQSALKWSGMPPLSRSGLSDMMKDLQHDIEQAGSCGFPNFGEFQWNCEPHHIMLWWEVWMKVGP